MNSDIQNDFWESILDDFSGSDSDGNEQITINNDPLNWIPSNIIDDTNDLNSTLVTDTLQLNSKFFL